MQIGKLVGAYSECEPASLGFLGLRILEGAREDRGKLRQRWRRPWMWRAQRQQLLDGGWQMLDCHDTLSDGWFGMQPHGSRTNGLSTRCLVCVDWECLYTSHDVGSRDS